MIKPKVNLIVDINNFVFSFRHIKFPKTATKRTKERFVVETLLLSSLKSVLTHAKNFSVDGIVIVSDSPNVWRRDIYAEYKANHTAHIEDPYFEDTIKACNLLTDFFEKHTAAYVIKVPRCEADDIIGVWCQESDSENIILSSDKDFIQLLNEKTRLYSPIQDCWRESEDPVFDLFVKCIRGDSGDNVRSAFPRVRETRLKKAWEDKVEMMNLLETTLPDGRKVSEALDMNIQLIDLAAIRCDMRDNILQYIDEYKPSKYSELSAMKFLTDNGLDKHLDVFRYKDRPLKLPPRFRNA